MKIYLAGPMRGYPQFNFPAFDAETARLRACGHTVFSPAERDREEGFDPSMSVVNTIDYYMAIDLPAVCKSDAVVCLPGWGSSQGANIEVAVGIEVGKKILHAETMEPIRGVLPRINKITGTSKTAAEICSIGTAEQLLHKPTTLLEKDLSGNVDVLPADSNPKDLIGLKKVPLRLVPPALMIFVSKVMALGAVKYGPYNWRDKKIRLSVYLEAAMRHILSAMDGEDADSESGMPHEAHAAACMGIILDAKSLGRLIDDRPPAGMASKLISDFTEKS